MNFIQEQSQLRILILAMASIALGGGLFGWGYWQGQRVKTNALTALEISPGHGATSIPQVNIPPNASPEMKEFLQNQATLADKMVQLRGPGPNGTLSPQAFAQFRQQNAELLKQQSQLAQIISQQQAKNTVSTPPPLQIPPKASPGLQAYLKERDQLMRDEIAFMNQHSTDDLATRQSAMQQWRQQNAARLQKLQQLEQAVTPTKVGTK